MSTLLQQRLNLLSSFLQSRSDVVVGSDNRFDSLARQCQHDAFADHFPPLDEIEHRVAHEDSGSGQTVSSSGSEFVVKTRNTPNFEEDEDRFWSVACSTSEDMLTWRWSEDRDLELDCVGLKYDVQKSTWTSLFGLVHSGHEVEAFVIYQPAHPANNSPYQTVVYAPVHARLSFPEAREELMTGLSRLNRPVMELHMATPDDYIFRWWSSSPEVDSSQIQIPNYLASTSLKNVVPVMSANIHDLTESTQADDLLVKPSWSWEQTGPPYPFHRPDTDPRWVWYNQMVEDEILTGAFKREMLQVVLSGVLEAP